MPERSSSPIPSAEATFIDQYSRKLLVDWASVRAGSTATRPIPLEWDYQRVYFEHAQAKGWISKDGQRITAAGFKTAAAFLKR